MGRWSEEREARDFRRAFFSIACRLRLDFLGVKTSVPAPFSSFVGVSPGPNDRRRDDLFLDLEDPMDDIVGRFTMGVPSTSWISHGIKLLG